MSFILDALKRAERERRLERPPDLTAVYEEDHLDRRGIRPWIWMSGAFLVVAVAAAFVLWTDGFDPDVPPAQPTSAIASSSSKAPLDGKNELPSSPAEKAKGHTPSSLASPEGRASKTPRPTPAQTPSPQPTPAQVDKTPQAQSPKKAAATEVKPPPDPGPKAAGETLTAKSQPTDQRRSSALARPVPPPKETGSPEPAAAQTAADLSTGNDMDDKTMTDQPSLPSPPPADAEGNVSPAKTPSIPSLSELPFEVRHKLGNIQINVHSYSEKPADRLVFINMKSLKIGDRIGEDGPILKEITPDGVIIDYGEGQARVQVWR